MFKSESIEEISSQKKKEIQSTKKENKLKFNPHFNSTGCGPYLCCYYSQQQHDYLEPTITVNLPPYDPNVFFYFLKKFFILKKIIFFLNEKNRVYQFFNLI